MGVVHDTAHHSSEVVEFRPNVCHSHQGMSHLWVAPYVITEALAKCEVLETLSVFHEFMTTIVKKGKGKAIIMHCIIPGEIISVYLSLSATAD